ncbi:MAG: DUF2846 domain-containing protein [Dongiaceae bacterium]
MRGSIGAVFICIAAIVSGCTAAAPLSSPEISVEAKQFRVPDGQSSIYVYRINQFFASGVLAEVYLDNDPRAVLGPGQFLHVVVAPGTHVVFTRSGGVQPPIPARTVVEAEPGEAYFIQVELEMGWTTNRIIQKAVNRTDGENRVLGSKMVELM